jgi:hypothetical protein
VTSRAALASLATGVATAILWLSLGTQPVLPDYRYGQEGWSGDFRSYYLPNAEYAGERVAAGALPLWNPHQSLGGPFLATLQVGILYPPNWLHALLPSPTAFVVLAFLHVVLAGLAAGLLASAFGTGAAGSAVAGLVYASSFQLVSSVYSPPLLYTAAWAPLLLFAVDRIVAAASLSRVALLALAVAMMLLAGWPYTLAMTSLGAAAYGGALLVAQAVRARRLPWGAIAALLLGVLVGAMLAAPQLLPTRDLVARSCRALGSVVEGQAIFVSRPHDPALFWRGFLSRGSNEGIPGAVALLLSVLAVLLPGPGRARIAALLAVGLAGLFASFPNDLPVYGWLRKLPLLGDFRFPFRYRFLTSLALSVGAGVGTAHLAQVLGRWPRLARGAGAAALLLCLATATIPVFRLPRPFPRAVPAAKTLAEELHASGVIVEEGDLGRIYWAERARKRGVDLGLDVLYDMEPLTLARTAEVVTFFETGRPRTLLSLPHELDSRTLPGDFAAAPFYGRLGIPVDGGRAAILDLLSVKWIVTPSPPDWLAKRYRRASPPDAELAVFENANALSRAYRVPGALRAPPRLRSALWRMVGEKFDPRQHVLLEDPPRPLLRAARARRTDPAATVEIDRYEEERVVLRTSGRRAGVVVLTDAYDPGWEATLDGRPVSLLRANVAFRGVAVPPGEHVIEMRYRPAELRWGAFLALAAAAGLMAARFLRRPSPLGSAPWRSTTQ